MRTMVATVTLSGVLAAALAASAVTSATAQDAPEQPAVTATDEEALVDRLVDMERGLPALPPSGVAMDDETTFGVLEGDFTSALAELDLVSEQARQLFIDADEADGDVADAVASVARGYLRLEQAYGYLSRYEDHDLGRPAGAEDVEGIATGPDTAAGLVDTGLHLVDLARLDAIVGYGVLRDTEAADDAEKGLFDAAYRETQAYLTTVRPDTAKLVSADSTAVLLAFERFETEVPGEARASDVTYICVERGFDLAALLSSQDPQAFVDALGGDSALLPTEDCPDVPSPENAVSVQGR